MNTELKYDLFSQDFYRHSFETFARMRREDPILRQPGVDGVTPIWFITRYKDVNHVLLNDDTFVLDWRLAIDPDEAARRGFGSDPVWETINRHLLTMEGEDHRRLRALVGKAFTPKIVAEMRPRIQQIADDLLDEVEPEGQMDLVEQYAFPLPITVIAELLGVPFEDRFKFREWSNAVVKPHTSREEWMEDSALLMGFINYLRELFEARREEPRQDLISALIQAEEAGERLSMVELFSMVVLLIIAGHETTVTLIGNATKALLTHPQAFERLKAHPDEMPHALEELLRYDPPVERALMRWVAQDTVLSGVPLKRGDLLVTVLASANHDEAVFDHPEELDLDRDARQHIAFGKGVHYCLGAPLARLEGEIALNTLLRRLPDLRMAVPLDTLEYRPVTLFHSLKSLPVTWNQG